MPNVSHHGGGVGRSWTSPASFAVTDAGVWSPISTGAGRVSGGRVSGTSGSSQKVGVRVADRSQVRRPRPGVQFGQEAVVVRLGLPPGHLAAAVVQVAEHDGPRRARLLAG